MSYSEASNDEIIEKNSEQHQLEGFKILEEFKKVYQDRFLELEEKSSVASEHQRNNLKLEIMTEWVKDLEDQNAILVETVHSLEKAALDRVKLLENQLQQTSNLIASNKPNPDKTNEELQSLKNQIKVLENKEGKYCEKIRFLESNIQELMNSLEPDESYLNKNQTPDAQNIDVCTCDQIPNVIENKECMIEEKSLAKQLNDDKKNMEIILHENEKKMNALKISFDEQCEINKTLEARLACIEKESTENRDALTQEVAEKHDLILSLKNKISEFEDKCHSSESAIQFKDNLIKQLRKELKEATKTSTTTRRVRINCDPDENVEAKTKNKLSDYEKQLEEFKSLLEAKNKEILNLKLLLKDRSVQKDSGEFSHMNSLENQNELLTLLSNIMISLENDREIITTSKNELQLAIEEMNFKPSNQDHQYSDIALANQKLLEMSELLNNFKTEILNKDITDNRIQEYFINLENDIICTQGKLNNENFKSENNKTTEISKLNLAIQNLNDLNKSNKDMAYLIDNMLKKDHKISQKVCIKKDDEKAIFKMIREQYCHMEEFRICTVEVQAATEDLKEEVETVISNLNTRHCKFMELNNIVIQVQDYLSKTKNTLSHIMNKIELKNADRGRYSDRINNNQSRLKDMKIEFDKYYLDFKKYFSNTVQQPSTLRQFEIDNFNQFLIMIIEELEQVIFNLNAQGPYSVLSISELKNQIDELEKHIINLKNDTNQKIIHNNKLEKSFDEKFKKLEKYECEIDNSHTKMQDVLENINLIREQMNEFGCIQNVYDFSQSTNAIIKLKEELRILNKEYEEFKTSVESNSEYSNECNNEWEKKMMDLEEKIITLNNELQFKDEKNDFFKNNVELLEKELLKSRNKSDYLRNQLFENMEFKKKILNSENSDKASTYSPEDKTICLLTTKDNLSQILKALEDKVIKLKRGLNNLETDLKNKVLQDPCCQKFSKLLSSGTECLEKDIENLGKYLDEVEKIKPILCSKDKLMQNKDEIIKIQKDSIQISQNEVRELLQKLQEKNCLIEVQKNVISNCEKDKHILENQIEHQNHTLRHLRETIINEKKAIDEISNNAASDVSDNKKSNVASNVFNHKELHDF